MRTENLLGSKVGRLTMASTSPLRGSSATMAPLRPSSTSSATACRSRSMVSCRFLPGDGFLDAQYLALPPAVIHHHLALAVDARKNVVVLFLDAELPDDGAGLVLRELWRIQLALADFTGIADDMRAESVLRIEAPLRVNQFQLREEFGIFVRFDERDIGRRQLLLDDDRFVLRAGRW